MRGDITQRWAGQSINYRNGIELALLKTIAGVREAVAKPFVVEFEPIGDNMFISQPTMFLTNQEATQIMQVLWDAGIRPNNGAGSTAEAAAMRAHLKFAETVVQQQFTLLDNHHSNALFSQGIEAGRKQGQIEEKLRRTE